MAASFLQEPLALVVDADILGTLDAVIAVVVLGAAARLADVRLVNTHPVLAEVLGARVVVVTLCANDATACPSGLNNAMVVHAAILGARVVVDAIGIEFAHFLMPVHADELLARIGGGGVGIVAIGVLPAAPRRNRTRHKMGLVLALLLQALVQRADVEIVAVCCALALAPWKPALHRVDAKAVDADVECASL